MKKTLPLFFFLLLLSVPALAQSQSPITVREADGSPKVIQPTEIVVPNGTLNVAGRKATLFSRSVPPVVSLTDATTISIDASLGNNFRVTLGGNRTLANPTNALDGQTLTFEVIQDATGSRTLAFGSKFAFGTDITGCTLTTTASKRDFITVYYNSTADKFYVRGCVKGY